MIQSSRNADAASVLGSLFVKTLRNLGPSKREFITALQNHRNNVSKAARSCGIYRSRHYDWLESDPNYRAAIRQLSDVMIQTLEFTALERAVEGVEEPVFHNGKQIATVRKFDNKLLMSLLAANHPKYGKAPNEQTETDGDSRLLSAIVAEIARRRATDAESNES